MKGSIIYPQIILSAQIENQDHGFKINNIHNHVALYFSMTFLSEWDICNEILLNLKFKNTKWEKILNHAIWQDYTNIVCVLYEIVP